MDIFSNPPKVHGRVLWANPITISHFLYVSHWYWDVGSRPGYVWPLAAAGAVVLDCRPPLLPVSMDIRGVDLSPGRLPAVSAGLDVLLPGREPLSNGGTC